MIDHMLGQNVILDEFKKIEIISSIFCDHNGMGLEINHKKKTLRITKLWWLNNMLLNNHWITKGIKRCLETK